ncbi:MAG: tRNA (adenosine(37)-N6)-threonylcarbamoyltransferase complex dimerization subunit type 1 TsaB [Candidatus Velthaea sp.]
MKLLAMDGALGAFSAACVSDGRVFAQRCAGNDALEAGLARVAEVLSAAGLSVGELERIAVGIGPGSFTGVRIALSFAKSLAYAAGIPIVGISSYDVLTPDDAQPPVLTAVHGRAGVVCARLRGPGGDTVACGPTAVVIRRLIGDTQAVPVLAGDTAEVLAALGPARAARAVVLAAPAEVPAVRIAALALQRLPAASVHAIAPDYGEVPAVRAPKGRN